MFYRTTLIACVTAAIACLGGCTKDVDNAADSIEGPVAAEIGHTADARKGSNESAEWIDMTDTEEEPALVREDPDSADEPAEPRSRKIAKRYAVKRSGSDKTPKAEPGGIEDLAKNAGILAYLGESAAPASPFGLEQAEGATPEKALAALMGDDYGVSSGFGNLRVFGTGRLAGGDGAGSIRFGDLGLNDCGEDTCVADNPDEGPSSADLEPRESQAPEVRISSEATVNGSLTKEQIREVVRRNLGQVNLCYEMGLLAQPDLEGRVAVKFLITGTGEVEHSAVDSSTVRGSGVDQCIARAVQSWIFPQPEIDGEIVATYPFQLVSPSL